MNNEIIKSILCVILIVGGITFQNVYSFQTNCNTIECLQNALKTAKPGDEIILASGTYKFSNVDKIKGAFNRNVYLHSKINGSAGSPITLRGESSKAKPVIEGVDYNDGYLLSLEGDYWIIKDIEFKTGSKGVILDNANYCQLVNIEVHDVGDEAIHLRDGSSYNSVNRCKVYDTGKKQAGFGEGIYVGSDQGQQINSNDPGNTRRIYRGDCHYNKVFNCILGPNVSAEHIDVKEGTLHTEIYNNTFFAEGITNENSADSFIDLKGMYGFVFENTFNCENAPNLSSVVDFSDRSGKIPGNGSNEQEKTGFRNAMFDNTINLGSRAGSIDTMKKASSNPEQTHMWDNQRIPDSENFPVAAFSERFVTQSCPTNWPNFSCDTGVLNIAKTIKDGFAYYPNPVDNTLYFNVDNSKTTIFSLYTVSGKEVLSMELKNGSSRIDVSSLAKGTYVMVTMNSKEITTELVVKD